MVEPSLGCDDGRCVSLHTGSSRTHRVFARSSLCYCMITQNQNSLANLMMERLPCSRTSNWQQYWETDDCFEKHLLTLVLHNQEKCDSRTRWKAIKVVKLRPTFPSDFATGCLLKSSTSSRKVALHKITCQNIRNEDFQFYLQWLEDWLFSRLPGL